MELRDLSIAFDGPASLQAGDTDDALDRHGREGNGHRVLRLLVDTRQSRWGGIGEW